MREWCPAVAAVVLLTGAAGLVGALPAQASGPAQAEFTTAEAVEFVDARLPELLGEQGVPGAVASVVSDGETVHTEGYGYADPESGAEMDPEDTAVLTGSVGKSFTAAAALELVGEGRIDLHEDVNAYLPEETRVRDAFPGQPVTLHHLLTHTAGFEEHSEGSATEDPADALALDEYVARHQPERVYPPGRFTAYSNFGYSLIGHLVAEVSGMPFEEYAEQSVFEPLGMADTSFQRGDGGLPEGLEPAVNHVLAPDGELTPAPGVGANEYPAGYAFTTAADMSRFMSALMDDGPLGGGVMLDRHAEPHPEAAAVGYGTYERYTSEPRVVGHFGSFLGANTDYALVPELDLGIFVAVNSDADAGMFESAWTRLVDEFLTEVAGVEPGIDATEPLDLTEEELRRYEGGYHAARVSVTEVTMLPAILGSYRPARAADGALWMSCSTAMDEQRWFPVGDGLFRSEDGAELAAFIEEDGEVVGFVCDRAPTHPYVKVGWWETPFPWLVAGGLSVLVVAGMLGWPIAALVRKVRGRPAPKRGSGARAWARPLAGATGLLTLGALAAVGAVATSEAMPIMVFTGAGVLGVPLALVTLPAAGVVVCAVLAWVRGWWGLWGRVSYTAVALALTVFLSVAYHVNLVWTPWY